MQEFLQESTIGGILFFDTDQRTIKKFGCATFFIAFCGLAFYINGIYVKWQINPVVAEEVNFVPNREIPFPAVTICNPIFSRDQNPNLWKFLQNPRGNFSAVEREKLAANVQACAPQSAPLVSRIFPKPYSSSIIQILNGKFSHINDSFILCSFQYKHTNCERLLNYVLTDKGFCFSYNLQGFNQLFNTREISDDFKSYKRVRIAKNYELANESFSSYETVNDAEDEIQWTLEGGYSSDSDNVQPTRAVTFNTFKIFSLVNSSDMSNLCPELGEVFAIYYHMPNEILTPFHKPEYAKLDTMTEFRLKINSFKANQNLQHYSPKNRGCYFEGEKPLKFFKSYTKALCEYECLANKTLRKCGCVKFSYPRNASTSICELSQMPCYLGVEKKFARAVSTCKCLHSCSRIDYHVKYASVSKFNDVVSARYTAKRK